MRSAPMFQLYRALRIEHEDGVVLYAIDQNADLLLALGPGLFQRGVVAPRDDAGEHYKGQSQKTSEGHRDFGLAKVPTHLRLAFHQ